MNIDGAGSEDGLRPADQTSLGFQKVVDHRCLVTLLDNLIALAALPWSYKLRAMHGVATP